MMATAKRCGSPENVMGNEGAPSKVESVREQGKVAQVGSVKQAGHVSGGVKLPKSTASAALCAPGKNQCPEIDPAFLKTTGTPLVVSGN